MKNQPTIHGFAMAVAILLVFITAHSMAASPNILLIVSEDNGPELGCYGDPYARTPNIDTLANEGVRFDNALVGYSVCSPSRACFLTGLHSHQNGQIGLATHRFAMYRVDTPRFNEQLANYYNCLARLDDGIGLLLDELEKTGVADNSLVIYIGDHGAQFPRGKGTVYEGHFGCR